MTISLLDGATAPLAALRPWPFRAPALPGIDSPVVAIGNFDGVHRGHRHVIAEAKRLADRLGRPLLALTFEPHPRTVFRPQEPVFRLTPWPMKAGLLADAGADAVLAVTFDGTLAGLTPEAFIDELLLGACGAAGVVVGFDFRFGRQRAGTVEMLAGRLAAAGCRLQVASRYARGDGEAVSSSAVRAALADGDPAKAAELLGYRWWLEARVEHGDKRGRELGFPTANLHLPPETALKHGIYAVRLGLGGTLHHGVASFGRRPTFDNGAVKLEVFIFDFTGDLYGQVLRVEPVAFIRPELKFDGVEPLIRQMQHDSAEARRHLGEAGAAATPSRLLQG